MFCAFFFLIFYFAISNEKDLCFLFGKVFQYLNTLLKGVLNVFIQTLKNKQR